MGDDRRQSGLWVESPKKGEEGHYMRQNSGPYQYYQPPAHHGKGRSFSERAGGSRSTHVQDQDPGLTTQHMVSPPLGYENVHRGAERHPELVPRHLAGPSYDDNMPLPRPVKQRPARVEPVDDSVPENMRSKPWSPEPLPLDIPQKPARHASDASKPVRRGSVPDRSPLQKLEYDISKEEKRARMKEAEDRTRRKEQRKPSVHAEGDMLRSGTMRGDKGRVVSDGSRKPNQKETRDEMGRHASTGGSHAGGQNGAARTRQAQQAVRSKSPNQEDQAAGDHTRVPDTRAYGGEQRRAARQRNEAGYFTNEPNVDRSRSERDRAHTRDAVPAGAGAAATISAAERGKAAHDRRKNSQPVDSAAP